MNASSTNPRGGAGATLLKIAQWVFTEAALRAVVQPTISDLQSEIADAGPHRVGRWRARWRGYAAFWRLALVAPLLFKTFPARDSRAVPPYAFPDMLSRLAVGSIVVSFVAVGGSAFGAWIAGIGAAAALLAIVMHRWYERHSSDLPTPWQQPQAWPQINISSTEVAGNVGGLIFVVGSVLIVVIGLPSVIWFLLASVVAGCLLAGALAAWHVSHPNRALPENRIVWR